MKLYMKRFMFALVASVLLQSCSHRCQSSGTDATETKAAMGVAVADTPPPAPVGDPDYQEDQSGPKPSDTIVAGTKYNRRQLDSIAKSKVVPWKYDPPKELAKPHDPPKQK